MLTYTLHSLINIKVMYNQLLILIFYILGPFPVAMAGGVDGDGRGRVELFTDFHAEEL